MKKLAIAFILLMSFNNISATLADQYETEQEVGLEFALLDQNNVSTILDDPATAKRKNTLKVGLFQNKPIVFSENGKAKGLFVDVLNHIANKEDWQIEYTIVNLKDYLADPHASKVDIMTCLGQNSERLKLLTYSKEPMWTFWGTVYSNSIEIQSVLDLQDRKVGVRTGNKITTDLKKLLAGFNVTPDYVEYQDYESAFAALKAKEIDAVAVNNTYAFTTLKANNIHKTPIFFSPFSAYFAMPKGRENQKLLDKIDSYVTALKNDNNSVYYRSIEKHQIGGTSHQWDRKKLLFFSAVTIIIVALGMGLWRYRSMIAINESLKKSIKRRKLAEEETLASNQQLRANEMERKQLIKKLRYTNNELQDIVYTTSHDLRSPLVNIQGFCGELSTDCTRLIKVLEEHDTEQNYRQQVEILLKDSIPESLGFITGSATKMANLLDGLLQVSRVGSTEIQSTSVDMNKILDEVLESTTYQINEHNIDIKTESLPNCTADSNMINTVLSNLIGNAIKYRDPAKKSEIRISGKVENGQSIYCVEDNGIGINPEYQKKVFEVFHRLNPNEEVDGEGLGLTIVTRIIDRLGGNIRLESEIDKGCKFYFALPTV